jgi:hypothetical protein
VYDLIDERDREILREAMTLHQKSLSSSTSSTVGSEPWMQAVHGPAAEPVDCAVNELSFTCRMNSTARGVRTVAAQSTLRTSFERQKVISEQLFSSCTDWAIGFQDEGLPEQTM